MEDAGVTIPLSWFLGTIATLGGVIAVMAREFFKSLTGRVEEARADTEKIITALNDNTNALNSMADAVSSSTGGS